jgi:immune inhibitor A
MTLLASLLLLPLLVAQILLWVPSDQEVAGPPVLPAEEAVRRADLPWRDLQELVISVKGLPREATAPSSVAPSGGREIGERDSFWVADLSSNRYYSVDATLRVVTPNAYMYLADGARVDQGRLEEAARFFEERIYGPIRAYFGPEHSVGIDGDHRVSIVHAVIPGLGGYFTSADTYPRTVHPYSNERKALYINVDAIPPGTAGYYSVLAHEFQHMIHWNVSRGEETWIKEGAAEVATEAAGLRTSGAARAFEAKPDTQLNAWAEARADVVPHYGAAYLFLSYFLQRFGGYERAADLLGGPGRGLETFDSFLLRSGHGLTFERVFKDWVVANYLDRLGVGDPRYRYPHLEVGVSATDLVTASTGWRDRTVGQFAADYIELDGRWSQATIRFEGDRTTSVIPARAHSGRAFWWSNRGDMADTTLTRVFDLRGVSSAALRFWTWYDLESDFDYAYVMASRDGGLTWQTLPARTTTTLDPNGNNLGHGFTGKSGGGSASRWIEEWVDLSGYAGEVVLLRFRQVTDDATNNPGFAVDSISVPELGYFSDASDTGGWFSAGFVRSDGLLTQHFSLQLIRLGAGVTVEQVPVSPEQTAEVVLDNSDGRLERAVLVVSGLTRHTTEPARYRYSVELRR